MPRKAADYFRQYAEHLRVISSCPVCAKRYPAGAMRVLEEKEDAHLVYLRCGQCRSSVLAVVLANQMGVSSVGLVTDLDRSDILRLRRRSNISTNDVLDVHQSLLQGTFLRSMMNR